MVIGLFKAGSISFLWHTLSCLNTLTLFSMIHVDQNEQINANCMKYKVNIYNTNEFVFVYIYNVLVE